VASYGREVVDERPRCYAVPRLPAGRVQDEDAPGRHGAEGCEPGGIDARPLEAEAEALGDRGDPDGDAVANELLDAAGEAPGCCVA